MQEFEFNDKVAFVTGAASGIGLGIATLLHQVPIALALSMPVFITPPVAKQNTSCTAMRVAAGALAVQCANNGTAYAQVREVVARQDGQAVGRNPTRSRFDSCRRL